MLAALAAAALDDRHSALEELREVVRLAAKEKIYQPFLEIHAQILPLLREFQREVVDLPSDEAAFVSELSVRMVATAKAKNHGDQLTARELDVLAHLRHGSSNKVIARALNLTENAVKFHMKNVFRKLDVDSRRMAAKVAQRLPLG